MSHPSRSSATSPRPTRPRRWGRVSANPSEYLIVLRRGRLRAHGPGLSRFLWPGDTYTVLPTTIQRVTFVADQVTAERVGVAVTGVAVYRIADPLLASRMLDFSERTAALDELQAVLRDMFVGAARRLVASLTVEACLTRRKESLAAELLQEIAPVVSGLGRADDAADQGWGLVIDTIEIQDVRILSEKVFSELQAPYRAELELRARLALVARDEQVRLSQEGARTRVGQAQLAADLAERTRTRELTDVEHSLDEHRAAQAAELAARVAEREHAHSRERAQAQCALDRLQEEARLALAEQAAASATRVAETQAAAERLQGELRLALERQTRALDNEVSDARIRYELVTRALPALAQALAGSLGPVQITQISSGEGRGLSFLAEALGQLLALGQAAGIELPGRSAPPAAD